MFMLNARSRVVDVPWAVLVLTRSLFFVAVMLALLVSAGVAYGQGTPTVPTVESAAVTSGPGVDGGYAIGDEIQVGLTFSEAVTVTGASQLTLDVGGQSRTAEYSEGSATTQLLFSYTVLSGDEDTDGIAVVANSLALNGGAIRAGSTNATLTHADLQAEDHKVDGIAPTVTVGGEPRTYVPPGRQFNVVFYFSEKVYGITDAEITVTNGEAHDVQATGGNDTWPKYTRWDVIIVPAAEGPVTVTLQAGAGADAYGNGNTAPDSALEVIAATPVTVEVARTTSGFAEGGRAEFTVTRSGDNGAIPVSLSLAQTGDFLSGAVQVYPPADPNNPDEPVTPQEFTFTETPFNLNVTFAAGETSKRIAVPTEDDSRDEDDGTVTLSVPARPDQYKYIPGPASSATADVRDNDVPFEILMTSDSYTPLSPMIEGEIAKYLLVHSRISSGLTAYLEFTEGLELLDLGGAGSRGYEHVSGGRIRVELRGRYTRFSVPTLEDETIGPGGRITLVGRPGDGYLFSEDWIDWTYRLSDDDSPPSVTLAAPEHVTEGDEVRYTITRTSDAGQSRAELTVNVQLEQTGDYITWPTAHQPDADGLVTIPVNFAARSLTATLTLEIVDDQMSEDNGSVTATILADADGSYVTGADSGHTTRLLDNDLPVISVAAVSAEVTEGTDAQFRFSRSGNTSVATRVGLWVGGLPKIMTDATEAIALTADNADLSQRLSIHGAWVDYILEFAAGETEKTLSLTTEADSVNEGDGWFGVTIVQRAGNLFGIGTGYAQVLVKDDDIPTVSLTRPVGPTGLTLSADGTTWEGQIGEKTEFSYSSVCTGVTEFSEDQGTNLRPLGMWVMYANHPAHYGEGRQDRLGLNFANIRGVGAQNCAGDTVTAGTNQLYVGPENGVLEIELLPVSELVARPSPPNTLHLKVFLEFIKKYEEAARAAEAAGTLITQKDIIHPRRLGFVHRSHYCAETDLRYCPKYLVGTVNKIRLTIINRDPTILIKAENSQVEEGQPARFVVERLWSKDVIGNPAPDSTTVVSLRASQNGQYITGALPTEITFGLNETRKVIELQTVGDGAFGENGSVTIELLPDTTGAGVNLQGKYTTWEIWQGHTPGGARSDRATIAITNNDNKPGITIAPASALEGDSGSADMIFTVTLAKAVAEAVTVNYATSDGTAIAGRDYTAVSNGSVTIAAGATTAEFTVPVTGDETDELDETFNVTISMPDPEPNLNGGGSGEPVAAITGGDTATAVGTILDDDPAVVTVAPKVDTVEEGEAAVFVLTRAGLTNGALAMQVRLRAPGRLQMLDARFEPGAVTTEIAVATHNNNLVDYPSVRDYTIEVFGDGAPLGQDDRSFTPGAPATATVKVTDDDELINVTVYPVKAIISRGNPYWIFRRDGDISQPLSALFGYYLHKSDRSRTEITYGATASFEAGQDEVVLTYHDYDFVEDIEYPPEDKGIFPITLTYTVFGDGGQYGLHRIYQGGNPNTATVTMEYNGYERRLVVGAEAPLWVSVGQTVNIPLMVTNAGSLDSGTQITITSTHYSQDRLVNGTNEPRMTCQFDGPIAAGESAGCEVSFLVLEKDLNPTNHAEIELDVVASDGRTTSNAFRIFMRVRNGVSVGFKETANLPVTEPGFGEANARANLTVTRVGQSGEEVQVAYTLEPWPTGFRSYSPVEGVDYADNSATPGVITFGENETEKTITIDILGDQIDEAKEQFLVTLVPPEGVLVEEHKRTRIVVINDTNPPPGESYRPTASLQLVSSGPVPESEGPVEFAIVLDREWGIDARYEVDLTFDQLTATPGIARLGKKGDFEDPGVLVVRIPAGQTRFEFSIPLYDDDVREEDETFQLLLGSSIDKSFRTIGPSNTALATIADDDRVPPTEVVLSLSHRGRALASVPEGSNRRKITVTASFAQVRWPGDAANALLHPADPLDVDTTVRVQVDPNSGATHAAGLDDFEPLRMEDALGEFQVVESFDIVIPAGQTSGAATVGFWPVKDDVDEQDETVTLQGSEVVAGNPEDSLPVRPASFTIIDDDTRGITTDPHPLGFMRLVEDGDPETYTVVLDSQPTDTVTIEIQFNEDGQLNISPTTLTFTSNDWNTPQTVTVWAEDDGIIDLPKPNGFDHEVSGGDYDQIELGSVQVVIEDTTVTYIYVEDARALESSSHVEFTVSIRPIQPTTPINVKYSTADGTAAAGSDYTREVDSRVTDRNLHIPAGRSTATIRIPISNDTLDEADVETFTLRLASPTKAKLAGDVNELTATGSIVDDDPTPVVSVAGPAGEVSYVSENAKDPVTFTLTLVGQSAGDVTVDYATGEAGLMDLFTARQGLAGATEGQDYAGASGTVTFTPGQTTKTVNVQVTDDDVNEETEFFGFRISSPQGADLRGQRSEDVADVGLLDDDPRGVAIGPTSIGLDEPVAGGAAVAGAYTMNLNSRPTDTVTVTIGGSDPAVSLSGDTLTNNQLTFTTTNWNTAQTITVTPVKDDNAAGETVTLTHTVSGGDYAGIAADSVTVNLTDSDTRNLVLSEESLAVTEGDATGVGYTVKLATQPSDTVTVTISGYDGADLTLSGTTLTNNQLTFTTTNWGTAQTVTVKPGDDDNDDNESETLAHTASGGDYVNITKDLPVSITDDGDPQVTFVTDAVTREVNENTGANQNVGSPVTATYTGTCTLTYTLGGTDAASFEIDSSTGQLKTRSGVTYDHEAKSTYTVTVTASDANCGADDATVTINVNDVNEPPRVPLEVVAHAVPRSYDQLFARWTPPENAGRPDITGYDIQYGQGSQFFGFSWRDGPQNVDGTSATISGPSPYSHYHVRVRAKNDEGSGPWSEPYFTTTNILDFEVETSLPFIPDGLVPGDRFHLLLVTQPAQALKTKLDDYYSLAGIPVITLPETNPFQRYWKFFYPVASIRHIDARVITNTTYTNEDKGVPVYWVGGGKAADDYEDFYDGDWDDESARNARGEPVALPDGVWTGSTADGRELIDGGTSRALGQSMAGYGAPGSTTTGEGPFYSGSTAANTEMKPIFSLSSVFRIVNPPLATNEGQMSDTDDRRSAMRSQAFTTGSNRHGYEFSGVALGKSYRETTRIELSIYSVDANGHPETRLFAFTNPDAYNSHTQAFNAPAGATLDPGATYAIVVQHATSGDDLNLYTTASDNEDDESLDGWSIADAFHYESGRSWQAEADGKALKIIVRGIAKAGPSLAPSGLTATAVGRDRIDLSWTAPTDDGGSAITGYRIESSADGSAGWADLVADTGSAATIYSHTGLMPNTTRHYRVSAINGEGASDPSDTANATTGDNPAVTVSFGQAAYTVLEGGTVTVTVTLNADPERTVVIPITATPQGATTTDDYTVPTSVTFDAGDMSKTIAFTATQDTDDDGESVKLTFGTLPSRVSAGTTATTTVSITDDDNPPTASDGTVTTNEDTSYTFAADEFGYADADGDALAHVKIIELPAAGTGALTLNGTAIPSADLPKTVTATELTGGKLKYAPPANANGTGYTSFKFKVNDGTADSASEYFMTINVTAVNDPATGTPTISGTAQVGQILTASTGDIADPDGVPSAFTYQWKRYAADRITFEANIGTDSMTYTLTASEEGKKVLVEVSFTDNGGSSEGPLISALYPSTQSQTVDPNNPPTASDGTVTTVEDTAHTFAAANFSYSDTDSDPLASVKIIELPAAGTGALTLNGTAIPSADLPKTVTAAEVTGGKLKYAPPANANGTGYASFKFKVNDGTADSASEYFITINVTAVNDPATGAPTISGTAQVGQMLTASTGDIADPDGVPSAFTYQWKRYAADRITFEANIGTDSMTYTLTASEEGKKVLVEVSFTDNGGSSEGPLVSALYPSTQSQTVDPNNPPTASDGTVTTVEDTDHTFAAANFSYSDTDSDPMASVKIIELPAAGTGALTLNGTAIPSADLPKTVTAAEVTGGKLKYAPPANANGTGYASFKFKVNDGAEDSASEYFMTINVTAVNDPATGAPTISGTAHVGLTLTASTAGIDDVDGLPSAFTYQWKRVDADGTSNPTDIGADSSTYTLTAAEEGKKVLVEVSFTDNGGSSEGPLVSAAYPSSGTVVNLTVSFGETTYMVTENGTISVIVHLSADPERTVAIPITATPQDSASSADYSVPTSVTFNAGDMSKTITFTATQDAEDDDGESVLLAFGILPDGVSPGTRNETTVSITDDDVPQVTVSFGQAAYTVAEGGTQSVTVTLSADPERTVVIPITHTPQDGADSPADYTVPPSVTFNTGQMSQTITFEAIQDEVDDDGESVLLAFGILPGGVSLGTTVTTTVSITDDDVPPVTVQFGATTYEVVEGETVTVAVTLSADPERTVVVPITHTPQSGADSPADYTVPTSVTFNTGQMSQTITFTAAQDKVDDDGESVLLGFGMTLPPAVSLGTTTQATVSITDDDAAGVTIEPAALSVVAGRSNEYTAALATEPTGEVTVTISGHAGTAVTLDKTTLTFTTDNWDTAQTVTVSATQNAATAKVTLAHTVAGADYGSVTAEPVVVSVVGVAGQQQTIQVGVSSSTQTLTVPEGGANSYTLVLGSRPTGDVAVGVTLPTGTDLTLDKTTLTFTSTNWDVAQTVTVTAAEDDDGVTDAGVTLTHTVSGGGYGSTTVPDVEVSITENDTAGLVLSKTGLTVTEGDAAGSSYTVKLATRPSGSVSVTISGHDGADLSLSGTTLSSNQLTFTVDDWNAAQTVTVKAGHDDDGAADTAALTHTASGGDYAGITADLPVTVTDDDTAAIVLSETGLTVTEGDAAGSSYTVKLATEPSGSVIVTISGHDGADLTPSGTTLTNNQLTFTTTNWATAQTVTVKAGQDNDGTADTASLTHTASGGDYASVSNTLPVSITDDDAAGVTIEPTTLSVVAGRSNEYTAALATEPTGEVTVTISGHAGTAVTLDKTTLTFTTDNWDTAQTVTVSATQNAATAKVTLAHTVAGADYGSVTAEPVVVSVVGVAGQQTTLQVGVSSSTQTLTVPEGGANSYTLVLGSRPTDDVTVGVTLPTGTDLTLNKTTLTFTSTNWDTAQTVTVTAAEDDDGVTDAGVTLTHTVSGGGYGSTTVPDVEVSITENDTAGLVLSETDRIVTEGDAAGSSYTVKLATEPLGSVSVTISGHDGADLTLSGTTLTNNQLTFTTTNWDTAQTVTIKAGQDDDGAADTATLTHTASGGDYAGITAELPVTVTDDDSAGIVLSETDLTVTEGYSAGSSYTVKLATEPSGSVIVTISGHDGADLTLSGTTLTNNQLTFTTTNWDTAQTVTVKAGDDDNADNESETLAHTAFGGDYVNVTKDLPVSITDDEVPVTVQFGATTYEVVEGETVTVAVTLSADPERTVVIPLTHTPQGNTTSTDYSGVPANVTFSTGDMSQTITFTATQDDVDDGGKSVLLAFGTTLPGGVSLGTTTTTTVNITDDDGAGVTVSNNSLDITEGSSGTYTIVLDSQPTANVTVTINDPTDNTDATADPASLTFASTDWSTPQTVTVSAAQDNDARATRRPP